MTLFNWVILLLGIFIGILIDSVWTSIVLKRFTIALDKMMEMNEKDEKQFGEIVKSSSIY